MSSVTKDYPDLHIVLIWNISQSVFAFHDVGIFLKPQASHSVVSEFGFLWFPHD